MNSADGSIDKVNGQVNEGEVDWDVISGEYIDEKKSKLLTDRLNEVTNELQGKE